MNLIDSARSVGHRHRPAIAQPQRLEPAATAALARGRGAERAWLFGAGLSSVEASSRLSVYGPNVLARLARLGITVKIVTGDNGQVAAHLCREVGLDPGEVVTGAALEALDDASLLALLPTTTTVVKRPRSLSVVRSGSPR